MTDELEPQVQEVEQVGEVGEVVPEEVSTFEVAGRKLTPDQLDPYVRFMDWAKTNPQGFDDLEAWERGEKVMVPKDQPTPTQQTTDLEDDFLSPALKERLDSLDTFQKAWYEEREAEKKAAIDSGVSKFTEDNGDLSPDEMQQVLRTARDHELIRIYLSRQPHDKAGAVKEAMTTALKITFPDREKARAAEQVVTDIAAKRKAAAATGGGASASRVEPEPEDPHQGLISDIRAAMNEAN